ncbi:hypothetical protein ANANG_G00314210 [Anguilla anguilla]|uniref:Uncharacterized protein n=1 Tax=Anguilla anguilla TaxID=7936 RepID=A0A9D3LIK5_ANGAN|nr:hypothetical protein ANANG_G00314210 [Anguilla anguilla]
MRAGLSSRAGLLPAQREGERSGAGAAPRSRGYKFSGLWKTGVLTEAPRRCWLRGVSPSRATPHAVLINAHISQTHYSGVMVL